MGASWAIQPEAHPATLKRAFVDREAKLPRPRSLREIEGVSVDLTPEQSFLVPALEGGP